MASIWDMMVNLGIDTNGYQAGLARATSVTASSTASMTSSFSTMSGVMSASIDRGIGKATETMREFSRSSIASLTGIPPQIVGVIQSFGALGLAVAAVIGLVTILAQLLGDNNMHTYSLGDKAAPQGTLGHATFGTTGYGPINYGTPTNSTYAASSSASTAPASANSNGFDAKELARVVRDAVQQVIR